MDKTTFFSHLKDYFVGNYFPNSVYDFEREGFCAFYMGSPFEYPPVDELALLEDFREYLEESELEHLILSQGLTGVTIGLDSKDYFLTFEKEKFGFNTYFISKK